MSVGTLQLVPGSVGAEQLRAEAEVRIINLGTDWSAGDSVTMFASAVTPLRADIKAGMSAKPIETVGASVKVSRKEALTVAAIEVAGGAGTDGADQVAALMGISEGLAASQTQTVGVYGGAKNTSTFAEGNPDATGGYFIGNITGGTAPKATAIGATIIGRRESGVTADLSGAEITSHNRAEASTYASGGASTCRGIWLTAAGTADSGCAINIGNPNARKFKVGIGVPLQNGGAVAESTFRDDGEAEMTLDIRGKHSVAAIRVKRLSGSVVIGHDALATASALLEVADDELSHTPIAVFGSTTGTKNYSVLTRNSAGSIRMFVGGEVEFEFAGSAIGDTGLSFTAGKTLRIGAVGKTHKITVTEGGLSFYGVAPVARHAAISEPAETLASLKAAVNGLRDALTKIGITE